MSLCTVNAGVRIDGQAPVIVAVDFDEEGWKHLVIAGLDTWVGTPRG